MRNGVMRVPSAECGLCSFKAEHPQMRNSVIGSSARPHLRMRTLLLQGGREHPQMRNGVIACPSAFENADSSFKAEREHPQMRSGADCACSRPAFENADSALQGVWSILRCGTA